MTATLTTTSSAPVATRRPLAVAYAGAVAAAAAAVTVLAAAADGLGVRLAAGDPGADKAQVLHPVDFAGGVVFSCALGAVLLALIVRFAGAPARTWVRVTVALTALSEVFPLIASHTTAGCRVTLLAAHVVAAAIVVPVVRKGLSSR